MRTDSKPLFSAENLVAAATGGLRQYAFTPTTTLLRPGSPLGGSTNEIGNAISGDYRIDVLLDSATTRFNFPSAAGTAAAVTFSFPTEKPASSRGEDAADWKTFNEEQRASVQEILSTPRKYVNLTFTEITDTPTSFGTIRFSNNTQTGGSAGYAIFPNAAVDQASTLRSTPAHPSYTPWRWAILQLQARRCKTRATRLRQTAQTH